MATATQQRTSKPTSKPTSKQAAPPPDQLIQLVYLNREVRNNRVHGAYEHTEKGYMLRYWRIGFDSPDLPGDRIEGKWHRLHGNRAKDMGSLKLCLTTLPTPTVTVTVIFPPGSHPAVTPLTALVAAVNAGDDPVADFALADHLQELGDARADAFLACLGTDRRPRHLWRTEWYWALEHRGQIEMEHDLPEAQFGAMPGTKDRVGVYSLRYPTRLDAMLAFGGILGDV